MPWAFIASWVWDVTKELSSGFTNCVGQWFGRGVINFLVLFWRAETYVVGGRRKQDARGRGATGKALIAIARGRTRALKGVEAKDDWTGCLVLPSLGYKRRIIQPEKLVPPHYDHLSLVTYHLSCLKKQRSVVDLPVMTHFFDKHLKLKSFS